MWIGGVDRLSKLNKEMPIHILSIAKSRTMSFVSAPFSLVYITSYPIDGHPITFLFGNTFPILRIGFTWKQLSSGQLRWCIVHVSWFLLFVSKNKRICLQYSHTRFTWGSVDLSLITLNHHYYMILRSTQVCTHQSLSCWILPDRTVTQSSRSILATCFVVKDTI